MKHLIRWILAATALTLFFTHGNRPAWNVVLSSALAAGVLTLGLVFSDTDWRHALVAVFVFDFIVGGLNAVDEAVFFDVMRVRQATVALIGLALVSLLLSVILSLGPPIHRQSRRESAMPRGLWARVPMLAVAYIILYIIAGTIVWPHVKSFYHARILPRPGPMFAVEFLRGIVFVAAAWPWLKMLKSRARAMVFFGAAYSILGGVAPLLLPNPLMPAKIRLAHGFEVGISNFVFGALLGWVLTPRPAPSDGPLPAGTATAMSHSG